MSGDPRALIAPLLARVLPSVQRAADDFVDPDTAGRIWTYERWPSRCSVRVLDLMASTRRHLADLRQPLLVIASNRDRVIARRGVELLLKCTGSDRVVMYWLERSGHLITADAQWQTVANQTLMFLQSL